MGNNLTLVLVATVVQFILGGLWYSPLLFGNWWMEFMEATHCSPEEIKKMQKSMAPFYLLQLVLTLLGTISLANLMPYVSGLSFYHLAFWMWIGFVAPTEVASVIWGRTQRKFWLRQIFVMVSCQFFCLMLAAWILSM